ncbi:SA1788 family PVL leukocidin-associated protein [Staphylococcus xylosus]|uniref:SA1788 family PVL leukocidin-associated protein n=1 Tax=Staphylococcus xylosus TaxID=1288 RepID=UPI000D1D364A|nr:SA1788 family PVL leukocidin-associated protein [Staphylococcus xylosus]PTI64192.1 hypothetical protein BU095_06240 [Staphylococcus xylosus]
MNKIRVGNMEYPLTEEMKADLEASGVSIHLMRMRLKKNWSLFKAINVPPGMTIEEFEKHGIKKSNLLSRKQLLEYELLKNKKPHLFDGTPQTHKRSEYVSNEMKHYAIARLKTDIYGDTQLI